MQAIHIMEKYSQNNTCIHYCLLLETNSDFKIRPFCFLPVYFNKPALKKKYNLSVHQESII